MDDQLKGMLVVGCLGILAYAAIAGAIVAAGTWIVKSVMGW